MWQGHNHSILPSFWHVSGPQALLHQSEAAIMVRMSRSRSRKTERREGGDASRNVTRIMAIVDALAAAADEGLRLADVMRATGLNKTTAHRLLAGLAANGLADQDAETGRFFVGVRLVALAQAAKRRFRLAQLVEPTLVKLARQTQDTVTLLMAGRAMRPCASTAAKGRSRSRCSPFTPATGVRSASARAAWRCSPFCLMRRSSEYLLEHAASRAAFPFDDIQLRQMIAAARRQGYAYNDVHVFKGMETITDMAAVGVPIMSSRGMPVAALHLTAITQRLDAAAPRQHRCRASRGGGADRNGVWSYSGHHGAAPSGYCRARRSPEDWGAHGRRKSQGGRPAASQGLIRGGVRGAPARRVLAPLICCRPGSQRESGTSSGREGLKTLNIYVPPGYDSEGEDLPASRLLAAARTEDGARACSESRAPHEAEDHRVRCWDLERAQHARAGRHVRPAGARRRGLPRPAQEARPAGDPEGSAAAEHAAGAGQRQGAPSPAVARFSGTSRSGGGRASFSPRRCARLPGSVLRKRGEYHGTRSDIHA